LARLALGGGMAGTLFGEPALGRLEAGAPADLIVLDYDPPAPLHDGSLAGHWMFGLSSARVRDVMVNGEFVVLDRRTIRVDADKVAADAAAAAGRLWTRLDRMGPHPFQPAGLG
jgi:cytosine/adenosine deaminase-related metal-dependent hydrolase